MSDDVRDGFFGASDGVVAVAYHGRVTIGSPVRAHLCDRDDGLASLVWDALGQAGWLGHRGGIHSGIEVSMRVPPAPGARQPSAPQTLRGRPRVARPGHRREGELGRITADGTVYQRYEGPIFRWGAGIRFVEGERRAEDFDFLEDMLYTAALRAGWLARDDDPEAVVEVPDIDIIVGAVPRDPEGE